MVDEPLADVGRLASRLPEPIETDEEQALADEMLSDASAEARLYGNQMWTVDSVPSGVVNIVLRAAARGYMNPAGFESEAADGARFSRGDEYVRGAAFTPQEQRAVRGFAKRSGITYAQVTKPNGFRSRSDLGEDGTVYALMAPLKPFPWATERDARVLGGRT